MGNKVQYCTLCFNFSTTSTKIRTRTQSKQKLTPFLWIFLRPCLSHVALISPYNSNFNTLDCWIHGRRQGWRWIGQVHVSTELWFSQSLLLLIALYICRFLVMNPPSPMMSWFTFTALRITYAICLLWSSIIVVRKTKVIWIFTWHQFFKHFWLIA